MVRTRGLTHIALAVRDLDASAAFYRTLLGAVEVYRSDGFVQLQTPGSWDVLVLEERPAEAGRPGGVLHFGFRLERAADLESAAEVPPWHVPLKAASGRTRTRQPRMRPPRELRWQHADTPS